MFSHTFSPLSVQLYPPVTSFLCSNRVSLYMCPTIHLIFWVLCAFGQQPLSICSPSYLPLPLSVLSQPFTDIYSMSPAVKYFWPGPVTHKKKSLSLSVCLFSQCVPSLFSSFLALSICLISPFPGDFSSSMTVLLSGSSWTRITVWLRYSPSEPRWQV